MRDETEFDLSHLSCHSANFDETCNLQLLPKNHPPCQTVFRSDEMGNLGIYPACHCNVSFFVFFGFLVMRTGHTGGPILMICSSYDVVPCKDVPFGGSVDIPPHLGVKSLKNLNLGGVNRHFQAKCTNIQTFILF